jgi:hypothetical protein
MSRKEVPRAGLIKAALAGQPRWRRDIKTDLAYWIFTPVVTAGFCYSAPG